MSKRLRTTGCGCSTPMGSKELLISPIWRAKGCLRYGTITSNFAMFVRIGSGGELAWSDEIDLCPDAMYLRITGKKPGDLFPALNEMAHEYA